MSLGCRYLIQTLPRTVQELPARFVNSLGDLLLDTKDYALLAGQLNEDLTHLPGLFNTMLPEAVARHYSQILGNAADIAYHKRGLAQDAIQLHLLAGNHVQVRFIDAVLD